MDMQLLLIIICVAAALFFIGRRFYRCLRKGQCSCGCENDGKKTAARAAAPAINCPDPIQRYLLHSHRTAKPPAFTGGRLGDGAFCY